MRERAAKAESSKFAIGGPNQKKLSALGAPACCSGLLCCCVREHARDNHSHSHCMLAALALLTGPQVRKQKSVVFSLKIDCRRRERESMGERVLFMSLAVALYC